MITVQCGTEWTLAVDDYLATASDLEDRRSLLRDLGALQVKQITVRVKDRVGEDGRRYKASRRALRDNGQTLIDRGHMLGNLGARNLTRESIDVDFSSAREGAKALFHQEGTKRGLPRRPFFGISRTDEQGLLSYSDRWLDRVISRRKL